MGGLQNRAVIVLPLACAAIAAALYSSSIAAAWVWDDDILIVRNEPALDEWADAPRGFTRRVIDEEDVGYYRPILMASYVVDRQLWGLRPGPFHGTNVALHALNTALVWAAIWWFFGNLVAATLGALFFAAHPIQAQAVGLILGRNDLLLVPPVLGLLCAADRAISPRASRWTAAAVILYAATLWTKETGLFVPAIVLLSDRFLRGRTLADVRQRIPLFASFGVVAVAYLLVRVGIFGAAFESGTYGSPTLIDRLRLAIAVVGYYVRHVVLPWGFAATPYHPGLLDPAGADFWIAVAFCAVVAAAALWGARRRPAFAFGLAFFAVALLPVSGLVPMKLFILEHRLYLPMVGVAFACAALVPARLGVLGLLGVGSAVAALGVATLHRVPVYRNSLALWSSAAAAAPRSAYAREEHGFALANAGRDEEAIAEFQAALRLNPGFDLARYKLALALERRGKRDDAIRELEELVRRSPEDTNAWNALGVFRKRAGDLARAVAIFRRALAVKPDDRALLKNLANAFEALKRWDEAAETLVRLAALEPANAEHWSQAGMDLYAAERYDQAADAFRRAIEIGGETAELRFRLGYALFKAGRAAEAVEHARRAEALGHPDRRVLDRLREAGALP